VSNIELDVSGDSAKVKGVSFYVLFLMSIVSLLNVYDRYLIVVLVQPIKHEFMLSDTQLGLLTGFVFALIYSISSIPIAHYADFGRHRGVLAASVAFWSFMTTFCGFAGSFLTLALARAGVAIGESGGMPTIQAIIAQRFPTRTRARAFSAIAAVSVIAPSLAMSSGGIINDHYGWRAAYWLAGPIGLVFSLLIITTIKRDSSATSTRAETVLQSGLTDRLSLRLRLAVLFRRRAFVWLLLGLAFGGTAPVALIVWTPAFLMRKYGFTTSQIG
jgi:predicted MFS family arabinose efflux permease